MRQCDGGNRSNAAVLCGALDAELQQSSAMQVAESRSLGKIHYYYGTVTVVWLH